jgi:hypothetical protein
MKNFYSNEEFGAVLRMLVERWCDERRLNALARILPAYLGFNGLTDGWAELSNALKATCALGYEAFNEIDWVTLNDLIHATDQALHRR